MRTTQRHCLTALRLALLALIGASCAPATSHPGSAPTASGTAAGFANVAVENRSSETLTIGFRFAAAGSGPVLFGDVVPGALLRLPPVPAGEPVVLFARSGTGDELREPPRLLRSGEDWVWIIPASTVPELPDR